MAFGELITTVTAPATAKAPIGAYDLTDLQTVKDELAVADSSVDTLLQRYVTSASEAAKIFCNRVFQKEGLLDELWPRRDPFPVQVTGGLRPLQLSRWPITSVPCVAGLAAPIAPTLTAVAGGALAATRYYVRITYLTAAGETAPSSEINLAVAASNLLQVASPAQDTGSLATGWNVYVGTLANKETLQNPSPLAIGAAFTLPTSGLTTSGSAAPDVVTVVENGQPLAEGIDFRVDYRLGQLTRLQVTTGYPRAWPAWPISVAYSAGYAAIPPDVADAVVRMVKGRYLARLRDPALRQESVAGAYEAQYWLASGPGASDGNLAPDVEAILSKYRVPVVA